MAIIEFRGILPSLNNSTRVTIAVPSVIPEGTDKWKVLWLLGEEGRSSDHYVRYSSIEALCEEWNMAVVMPEGLHSDYENMVRGLNWFDYIAESLPRFVYDNFPVSDKKEDNYVLGFGMGGLGAIRLALRKPDNAAAFGSCRADLDVFSQDSAHDSPDFIRKMQTIYGDDFRSDEILDRSDPYRLISHADRIPPMMIIGSGNSFLKIKSVLSGKAKRIVYLNSDRISGYDEALTSFHDMIEKL